MRSDDATEIAAYASQRTVYSQGEIEEMTDPRALAIRFRQDRLLAERWPLAELRVAGVLKAAPRSIQRVRCKEGIAWLTERLAEPF